MTVVHETAYPHLSANITKSNLQRIYTPNDKELIWLKQQRLTRESLLVASIYLKCFQRLGYFPKLENVPDSINFHIASCLMLDFSGSHNSVPPSTQRWLKNRIRHYCGVSKFTLAAQGNWIKETAKSLARTKENIIDIINALLEILIKEQFELPAQSTLERIAYSARAQCNAEYFEAIEQSIPNDSKQRLLNLLTEIQSDGTTLWTRLKYEPEKPSVRNLQHFIKHTIWLKDLQAGLGLLPELPEEKRLQFYYEAQSFPSNRMKELKYKKRIALMTLVVHENLLRSTDFLVDLFIREIRKLHSKAQALPDKTFEKALKDQLGEINIKDINSLVFFKPDGRASYPHIDSLFSENINYSVIREHYRDMLRIAISISEGKVSASTIIRRLGSKGIRNTLYYAFRELGRVVRTQFLLQYVSDVELRETVQAATCKSEDLITLCNGCSSIIMAKFRKIYATRRTK